MKLSKIGLIFALFLISTEITSADPGDTLWTRLYGGEGNDIACSIHQANDGGFFIGGTTEWSGNGENDMYLVRTDVHGETLWTKTYGGAEEDYASSMQLTTDGGVIIAGWTNSFGAGGTDFYLVKTDSAGDTLWTNTFGGVGEDSAKSVTTTSDGGFVLCGTTNSFGNGYQYDVYVVKTDSLGQFLWDHRSGGVVDDGASSIQQTRDGGYILAGRTANSDGNHNIYVEKLNAAGHTTWYQAFSPGIDNQAASVIQVNDGNYVVAGYAFINPDALQYLLMKISANGSAMWTRTYGSNLWEVAYSVRQTSDHGYAIAGSKWVTLMPDSTQLSLVRTDSLGHLRWDRTYSLKLIDEATSLDITQDGNYALIGYACNSHPYSCDIVLVLVEGEQQTANYNDNSLIARPVGLGGNYPNPFNTRTIIDYSLAEPGNVSFEIFDIAGRLIERLERGEQIAGNHQLIWDAIDQPSGTYLVRMTVDQKIATIKVTLLK